MLSSIIVAKVFFVLCGTVHSTTTTGANTPAPLDYSGVGGWYCPMNSCLNRLSPGNSPTNFECIRHAQTGNQCGGGFVDGTCQCNGRVRRGVYETDLWTNYTAMGGSIGNSIECSDTPSAFQPDPAHGQDKFCWCEWLDAVSRIQEPVALASGSNDGVAVCIYHEFCASLGQSLVYNQVNAQTSVQGLVTMILKNILTSLMPAGTTVLDATYATDGQTLTRNGFTIGVQSATHVAQALNILDAMDEQAVLSNYLNGLSSMLTGSDAVMLSTIAPLVQAVTCDDSAFPSTTPESTFESSSAPPKGGAQIGALLIAGIIASLPFTGSRF